MNRIDQLKIGRIDLPGRWAVSSDPSAAIPRRVERVTTSPQRPSILRAQSKLQGESSSSRCRKRRHLVERRIWVNCFSSGGADRRAIVFGLRPGYWRLP